jgi:hypothetical protein
VVLDEHGNVLLLTKVDNDETALLELIGTVAGIAAGAAVCWATDLNAGGAAMLIALLTAHGQHLLYLPGRIVHHAAATYRGDGKTDAKDARITADQARMRTDLQPVRRSDPVATDLRLLTARRTDVVCDRVRAINRLRAAMSTPAPLRCRKILNGPVSAVSPAGHANGLFDRHRPHLRRAPQIAHLVTLTEARPARPAHFRRAIPGPAWSATEWYCANLSTPTRTRCMPSPPVPWSRNL